MPLPTPGIEWPPRPFDIAFWEMAENQVWWEGTSSKLTNYYSTAKSRAAYRTSSRLAHMWDGFWGKNKAADAANAGGQRLHLPLAADLAQTSANLLFSEPPLISLPEDTIPGPDGETIEVPCGNDAAQARLDLIVNTPEFHAELLVAAEACAALGGVYLRVVWDSDLCEHAWIDTVDADRAIPEFRWGKLVAVTFWNELGRAEGNTNTYRHLQRYEPGRIIHGLYAGDGTDLGNLVPLEDHRDTAFLADLVDAESSIPTGSDKLAAAYIPNLRPNPSWRFDAQLRNLGRSDLAADVVPLMAAVDEAYSSLMRDLRLAKARLIVSRNLVTSQGPGKGGAFDIDHEVYDVVNDTPGKDGTVGAMIEAHQFAIRTDEHFRVIDQLTREILRRCGYSPLTFGLVDDAAPTATEISARTRTSNQTRQAKTRLWRGPLSTLIRTLIEIDAVQFGTGAVITEDVRVEWPPAVQESAQETAQTLALLEQARAVSTETKVKMMHPGWDQQDIDEEVDAIKEDQGLTVPDLGAVTESDFAPADTAIVDGKPADTPDEHDMQVS